MTFREILQNVAGKDFEKSAEPLAKIDYAKELQYKEKAFQLFLEKNHLPLAESLIKSPRARNYRATSKRRVFVNGDSVKFSPENSLLEPKGHLQIFAFIFQWLEASKVRAFARALNWIIVRGQENFSVIFNVEKLDAKIVRQIKMVAEAFQKSDLRIISSHVYVDSSRSDYYLESFRPEEGVLFKQLYGPKFLSIKLPDLSLRYPITGFSQINESQIPNLLDAAKKLLRIDRATSLLDLYCGYGLFAFGIGREAQSVLGAEWTRESVEYAKKTALFLKSSKFRFIAGNIDAPFIRKALPTPKENEVILLDPPRNGSPKEVISALAERGAERILHIFCGTDEIPASTSQWKASGYRIQKIVPLDLFPGTAHLETLILFSH